MSEAFSGICVLSTEELDAVSGGGGWIIQTNVNRVDQDAKATNSGAVTATASGSNSLAAAFGATAVNVSTNHQYNIVY
jgi:hypothetical protein